MLRSPRALALLAAIPLIACSGSEDSPVGSTSAGGSAGQAGASGQSGSSTGGQGGSSAGSNNGGASGAGASGAAGSSAGSGAGSGAGGSDAGSGGASGASGSAGSAGSAGGSAGAGAGGAGGQGGGPSLDDPTTCEEAKSTRSYVGCDFWPTVLDNIVRPDFDYAVIAANTSDADAEISVERGGNVIGTTTLPPGALVKIHLPWVPELKGIDSIAPGCQTNIKDKTTIAKQGAYHVTSSRPIALYQFNALEYEGKGGPPGKSWASCQTDTCFGQLAGKCFSYTNDASLLLPSTTLGTTYRITGASAWKLPDDGSGSEFVYPPYFSVTATQDSTSVSVKLSATGTIAAGAEVAEVGPGGTATLSLNKGDVALVVGKGVAAGDFSGSLVTASAPVQVMTGIACTNIPHDKVACDHLEETVLPAEFLGRHYFVTVPSGPGGTALGHVVRLYGHVDGTKLTYPGANPGGPATLDAGQVVELDVLASDFEVIGDHGFGVASFQVGAGPMSGDPKGDPAQSFAVATEQFRVRYVFLAPDDYEESYADVVQPLDAQLTLDGEAVTASPVELSSGYGVTRLKLGPGQKGAHVLTASKPVGLQVMGYGAYTSYQYPGGLNLVTSAP